MGSVKWTGGWVGSVGLSVQGSTMQGTRASKMKILEMGDCFEIFAPYPQPFGAS